MKTITITSGQITLQAELNESHTAKAIWEILPIDGTVNTWGDEIYFKIPLDHELEPDACEEVEIGDLGYWPTGQALCIFFGPTPVSTSNKPRAASAVNMVGKISGDTADLKNIPRGSPIRVERAT